MQLINLEQDHMTLPPGGPGGPGGCWISAIFSKLGGICKHGRVTVYGVSTLGVMITDNIMSCACPLSWCTKDHVGRVIA